MGFYYIKCKNYNKEIEDTCQNEKSEMYCTADCRSLQKFKRYKKKEEIK